MKIAVYVQGTYTRRSYDNDSFEKRVFRGINMISDVLRRAGYPVEFASKATVKEFDIILVSIVSATDWFDFGRERITWPKGDYKVIIGGAGMLDIRPFLFMGDAFVFGRGEDIIVPLVQAYERGDRYINESVAYADTFNADTQKYKLAQATQLYPHALNMGKGKPWIEQGIGCRRKCLFCNFSWGRQFMVADESRDGAYVSSESADEGTMWEYDPDHPEDWNVSGHLIVGVDGMSERMRFMVNKYFTNERMTRFIVAAGERLFYRIKLCNICGYPGETDDDYIEFIDTVEAAFRRHNPERLLRIESTFNHFRAMPNTPSAIWPMRYENMRNYVWRFRRSIDPRFPHKLLEIGNNSLTAPEMTESLATVTLWALALRGTEADTDAVKRLLRTKQFWGLPAPDKSKTLETVLDIDRLFGEYTWDNVPTKYLETYVPNEGLARLSDWRARLQKGNAKHDEEVSKQNTP